jgi:hypothetical protein
MRKESSKSLAARVVWSVILMCSHILASSICLAASQIDEREIVRQANQSYYDLRKLGLLEFKANVQPNWDLMAKRWEPNPEALKMLKGLMYSVSLRSDGSVKVNHEASIPIPGTQEENVKQLSVGMDQMLSGFFVTWNLFMLRSPLPAVESDYQLENRDGKYVLTYQDGDAHVLTTMTKELAVLQIEVSSPTFKASIKPQFLKTAKGYVLVGYQATYDPVAGPGKTTLGIQLDYQEVSGLQLPRKLNLDGIYDGSPMQVELQFSQYQLKLADSGVPPKSN